VAAIVLASTSSARKRLLTEAGWSFEAVPSRIDEGIDVDDPVELVRTLAVRKARAVAAQRPDAWVIGADQVVYDPGAREPWGKPPSDTAHLARLQHLRGRRHELVTGVALVRPEGVAVAHATSALEMRADVSDEELEAYVACGEGRHCAGGYAVEGRGAFLFERIDGDYTNVLGLPMPTLYGLLRDAGWRFGEGA